MSMKTIEHVHAGEKIRASTINNIIDATYSNGFTGVGNYRTSTTGIVHEYGDDLVNVNLKMEPDSWQVDPITLKITNAWLTVGEATYGACITRNEEKIGERTEIDFFHMIDFGKDTIDDGDYEGDYYIRISNSFIDDPDSTTTQEDLDKESFDDFYSDNVDEENKVNHYFEIQVVKDTVKNGGTSSLKEQHGIDVDDCVYFKFFTIYGPHDNEKDEQGKKLKAMPPYNIHYYTRSFGGGFGQKEKLKPWKTRWIQTGKDESEGKWQAYLPIGCAVQNNTMPYYPANEVGEDKDGQLTYQWYDLPEPDDKDADVTVKKGYTYKQWTAYALFMDYPLMKITTNKDDNEFKTPNYIPIGTLLLKEYQDEEGKSRTSHTAQQLQFEMVNRAYENAGAFRMYFKCNGDKTKAESYTKYMTNQYINVGRTQIWIEDDTNITDFEDVVLKIDHSKEDIKISIVNELEDNDLDNTYIRMLRMEDGVVVDDLRDAVRKEFDFYLN